MAQEHQVDDFIHRFIPAENNKQFPVLLMLHGTGDNELGLLNLGRMLSPGAAILSPRGKVLENGMPRFFRRVAEGVFDQEDLARRTDELANWIQAASATYAFDPTRVIAVGYSNGANIAGSMLFRHPKVLAGAILLHPMVPFIPETLPDLSSTPIFIGAGRADPIVRASETEQLEALLKRAGATVTTCWHNGDHSINHEEVREARTWLNQINW